MLPVKLRAFPASELLPSSELDRVSLSPDRNLVASVSTTGELVVLEPHGVAFRKSFHGSASVCALAWAACPGLDAEGEEEQDGGNVRAYFDQVLFFAGEFGLLVVVFRSRNGSQRGGTFELNGVVERADSVVSEKYSFLNGIRPPFLRFFSPHEWPRHSSIVAFSIPQESRDLRSVVNYVNSGGDPNSLIPSSVEDDGVRSEKQCTHDQIISMQSDPNHDCILLVFSSSRSIPLDGSTDGGDDTGGIPEGAQHQIKTMREDRVPYGSVAVSVKIHPCGIFWMSPIHLLPWTSPSSENSEWTGFSISARHVFALNSLGHVYVWLANSGDRVAYFYLPAFCRLPAIGSNYSSGNRIQNRTSSGHYSHLFVSKDGRFLAAGSPGGLICAVPTTDYFKCFPNHTKPERIYSETPSTSSSSSSSSSPTENNTIYAPWADEFAFSREAEDQLLVSSSSFPFPMGPSGLKSKGLISTSSESLSLRGRKWRRILFPPSSNLNLLQLAFAFDEDETRNSRGFALYADSDGKISVMSHNLIAGSELSYVPCSIPDPGTFFVAHGFIHAIKPDGLYVFVPYLPHPMHEIRQHPQIPSALNIITESNVASSTNSNLLDSEWWTMCLLMHSYFIAGLEKTKTICSLNGWNFENFQLHQLDVNLHEIKNIDAIQSILNDSTKHNITFSRMALKKIFFTALLFLVKNEKDDSDFSHASKLLELALKFSILLLRQIASKRPRKDKKFKIQKLRLQAELEDVGQYLDTIRQIYSRLKTFRKVATITLENKTETETFKANNTEKLVYSVPQSLRESILHGPKLFIPIITIPDNEKMMSTDNALMVLAPYKKDYQIIPSEPNKNQETVSDMLARWQMIECPLDDIVRDALQSSRIPLAVLYLQWLRSQKLLDSSISVFDELRGIGRKVVYDLILEGRADLAVSALKKLGENVYNILRQIMMGSLQRQFRVLVLEQILNIFGLNDEDSRVIHLVENLQNSYRCESFFEAYDSRTLKKGFPRENFFYIPFLPDNDDPKSSPLAKCKDVYGVIGSYWEVSCQNFSPENYSYLPTPLKSKKNIPDTNPSQNTSLKAEVDSAGSKPAVESHMGSSLNVTLEANLESVSEHEVNNYALSIKDTSPGLIRQKTYEFEKAIAKESIITFSNPENRYLCACASWVKNWSNQTIERIHLEADENCDVSWDTKFEYYLSHNNWFKVHQLLTNIPDLAIKSTHLKIENTETFEESPLDRRSSLSKFSIMDSYSNSNIDFTLIRTTSVGKNEIIDEVGDEIETETSLSDSESFHFFKYKKSLSNKETSNVEFLMDQSKQNQFELCTCIRNIDFLQLPHGVTLSSLVLDRVEKLLIKKMIFMQRRWKDAWDLISLFAKGQTLFSIDRSKYKIEVWEDFDSLFIQNCLSKGFPHTLQLYLDYHKLAIRSPQLIQMDIGDHDWAHWLLATLVSGGEFVASISNAKCCIPLESQKEINLEFMFSSHYDLIAMSMLVHAPVPPQRCILRHDSLTVRMKPWHCHFESVRETLRWRYPTLLASLSKLPPGASETFQNLFNSMKPCGAESIFRQTLMHRMVNGRGENREAQIVSKYLRWRDSFFYSAHVDISLSHMIEKSNLPKNVKKLAHFSIKGINAYHFEGDNDLQVAFHEVKGGDSSAKIAELTLAQEKAFLWEKSISDVVKEELHIHPEEAESEHGLKIDRLLIRSRPLAAFDKFLSQRAKRRNLTYPLNPSSKEAQSLLQPLSQTEYFEILSSIMPLALKHFFQTNVVASCICMLELCGIDSTKLKIEIAALRCILEFSRSKPPKSERSEKFGNHHMASALANSLALEYSKLGKKKSSTKEFSKEDKFIQNTSTMNVKYAGKEAVYRSDRDLKGNVYDFAEVGEEKRPRIMNKTKEKKLHNEILVEGKVEGNGEKMMKLSKEGRKRMNIKLEGKYSDFDALKQIGVNQFLVFEEKANNMENFAFKGAEISMDTEKFKRVETKRKKKNLHRKTGYKIKNREQGVIAKNVRLLKEGILDNDFKKNKREMNSQDYLFIAEDSLVVNEEETKKRTYIGIKPDKNENVSTNASPNHDGNEPIFSDVNKMVLDAILFELENAILEVSEENRGEKGEKGENGETINGFRFGCGEGLKKGGKDMERMRKYQYELSDTWKLVSSFCKIHSLPLSDKYLRFLARDNDWVGFLAEAQTENFSLKQLYALAAEEFENNALRNHILAVLRTVEKFITDNNNEKPPSTTPVDFPEPSANSTSYHSDAENWGLAEGISQGELFSILADCEKKINPGSALLEKSRKFKSPFMALIASCYSDVTVEGCISTWLNIIAHRMYKESTIKTLSNMIVKNISQMLKAFNKEEKSVPWFRDRQNPKCRRKMLSPSEANSPMLSPSPSSSFSSLPSYSTSSQSSFSSSPFSSICSRFDFPLIPFYSLSPVSILDVHCGSEMSMKEKNSNESYPSSFSFSYLYQDQFDSSKEVNNLYYPFFLTYSSSSQPSLPPPSITPTVREIELCMIEMVNEVRCQAPSDLVVNFKSEPSFLSFPSLVYILCKQKLFLPVIKSLELFLPHCAFLPFVRFLMCFSQMRLTEAANHLKQFNEDISTKESATWIKSTALLTAESQLLLHCNSFFEQDQLLKLLTQVTFGDGQLFLRKFHKCHLALKFQVLTNSKRGLRLQKADLTMDKRELLRGLIRASLWKEAYAWANELDEERRNEKRPESRDSTNSLKFHELVVFSQANSMISYSRQFFWKVTKERMLLWKNCDSIFLSHEVSPIEAGKFFLNQAQIMEKERSGDFTELHLLYSTALKWFIECRKRNIDQNILFYDSPVNDNLRTGRINIFEIETKVWVYAVKADEMKNENGTKTANRKIDFEKEIDSEVDSLILHTEKTMVSFPHVPLFFPLASPTLSSSTSDLSLPPKLGQLNKSSLKGRRKFKRISQSVSEKNRLYKMDSISDFSLPITSTLSSLVSASSTASNAMSQLQTGSVEESTATDLLDSEVDNSLLKYQQDMQNIASSNSNVIDGNQSSEGIDNLTKNDAYTIESRDGVLNDVEEVEDGKEVDHILFCLLNQGKIEAAKKMAARKGMVVQEVALLEFVEKIARESENENGVRKENKLEMQATQAVEGEEAIRTEQEGKTDGVREFENQMGEGNTRLSSILSELLNSNILKENSIDFSDLSPLQIIESLYSNFENGRGKTHCERIITYLKLAEFLNIKFSEVVTMPMEDILPRLIFKNAQSLHLCKILLKCKNISSSKLANIICQSFLKELLLAHSKGITLEFENQVRIFSLHYGEKSFQVWAQLCDNEKEIGLSLFQLLLSPQVLPPFCEVEIILLVYKYYKENQCVDELDILLRLASEYANRYVMCGKNKSVTSGESKSELSSEIKSAIRLLIGLTDAMILHTVIDKIINDGYLISLIDALNKSSLKGMFDERNGDEIEPGTENQGREKETIENEEKEQETKNGEFKTMPVIQMAILHSVKRIKPSQLELALKKLDMKYEVADFHERQANEKVGLWKDGLSWTRSQEEDEDGGAALLLEAMDLFCTAAEIWAIMECGMNTVRCLSQASLLGLQITMPDTLWVGLVPNEARKLMEGSQRFPEALVVAHAYGLGQPNDWVPVLWAQLANPRQLAIFLEDFLCNLPLPMEMLTKLAGKYRAEMGVRSDASRYMGTGFRLVLWAVDNLELRHQLALSATTFPDVVDDCLRRLDRVPDNSGPLILRRGHGGNYMPMM